MESKLAMFRLCTVDTYHLNLVSTPEESLSFQQAPEYESHVNPSTSTMWVKVAVMAKAACRYSFIVLRTPALSSSHTVTFSGWLRAPSCDTED